MKLRQVQGREMSFEDLTGKRDFFNLFFEPPIVLYLYYTYSTIYSIHSIQARWLCIAGLKSSAHHLPTVV